MSARIPLDQEKIAEFCQRWQITEFALFGSVLREDFRPESDVDVLVAFASDADWSLFDQSMSHDSATLLDILKAARLAVEFREGMEKRAFFDDPKTQSAVLHQLLILGEAAKSLSSETGLRSVARMKSEE